MKLTLTVGEIKTLAECVGLRVADGTSDDDMEGRIIITEGPQQGIKEDDGTVIHCRYMAYWEDYPEEGVMPLDRITKTREDIVIEAGRMREEIAQIVRDADHWNNHVRKPDENPIDPDLDGQMGRLAQSLDVMLARETKLGLARSKEICVKCAHKMTLESDFNPETGEKAQPDWWECTNCEHREVV